MLHYARKAVEIAAGPSHPAQRSDDVRMLALQRRLEIIGEAANSVPVETQAQFPDIAFQQAIAMRHRLIHGYNRIKISIVEATAQDDLPGLIASLERALDGALPGD
ncbi:DUF86 domain-containing protein [Hyphomonadaceae bacterium ML37]|nr:DUF86 domain-containing protein [Hyphomonadaceae bacterium ML37]